MHGDPEMGDGCLGLNCVTKQAARLLSRRESNGRSQGPGDAAMMIHYTTTAPTDSLT